MPIYDFLCASCGRTSAEFRSVNERDTSPECKCGTPMTRQRAKPRVWAPTRDQVG